MRCIQARSALFWLACSLPLLFLYSSAEMRVDGVDYYYKQKHTCAFNRFSYLLTNKRLIGVEVSCRRSRGQSRLWGWREVKPYTNHSSKSNNQYHPIKEDIGSRDNINSEWVIKKIERDKDLDNQIDWNSIKSLDDLLLLQLWIISMSIDNKWDRTPPIRLLMRRSQIN